MEFVVEALGSNGWVVLIYYLPEVTFQRKLATLQKRYLKREFPHKRFRVRRYR
jgi:hypothetical protein